MPVEKTAGDDSFSTFFQGTCIFKNQTFSRYHLKVSDTDTDTRPKNVSDTDTDTFI